ncbi:MAG: outer membrane beta-barrel protein, partial [Candidatus Omnitrophota bacterium]|nr:outer membrane beta-barrel protein [Candidatus Omnitrophota bacterium]
WIDRFDKEQYEESIPYMKKAVQLDPSYSARVREHVELAENQPAALSAGTEDKKREILARETARELITKKKDPEAAEKEISERARQIRFGPLTMNPYIEEKFTWDDNIYLTPENKKADYISQLSPGIIAKIDMPSFITTGVFGGATKPASPAEVSSTIVNLAYNADIEQYFSNPKNNNVGHNLVAATIIPSNLFGGKGKTVFALKDAFKFTTDPATTEITQFYPRYHNDMEARVKYTPREKIAVGLVYKQSLEWYTQKAMQDFNYMEDIITPALYYDMTPKSALFVDTDLGKVMYYTGNRDSIFYQISGGVTGQITPKTNVHLKVGAQIRTHKDAELYGDYAALTATGSIATWLRRDIYMNLSFGKHVVESTYQNNAYFDLKYAQLQLIKHLTGKLAIEAGVKLGRNDYPKSGDEGSEGVRIRRDFIWTLKGGISYKILKWIDSTVSYELKGSDSNFRKFNYMDNRIIANVKALY